MGQYQCHALQVDEKLIRNNQGYKSLNVVLNRNGIPECYWGFPAGALSHGKPDH